MSIINPLSPQEIRADFTHYGWLAFCPVYLAEDGPDGVKVCERNGIPAWVFGAAEAVMALAIFLLSAVDHYYKPQWGFIVTGEIEHA
ncbi:hypothetical protein [Rhodanobacter denitrificans]|uniref:Uncharacterized protein n=1 Tax=Rhodanobacter denitrificans TaxID=666685 RepID=M4NJN9_9GAMM|nr:hypothetical protein [Rhodanobacter denitrificans]AGG89903.1 hypothetical protein R2APBS1_2826 [Rhodanobacter denitrificans]UJM85299.1 hypothetical protein LRJ86_10965 [Rhodanobacter denitrificans]